MGEWEAQTTGCQTDSRMYCASWGIQPRFHNTCNWKVTFKNYRCKHKKFKKTSLMNHIINLIWGNRARSVAELITNDTKLTQNFNTMNKSVWNMDFIMGWSSFPSGSDGKESACNAGDLSLIPGLGGPPGEGKGYPLQYSSLENSRDYTVHGVTKSQTWLSDFHFQGVGRRSWFILPMDAQLQHSSLKRIFLPLNYFDSLPKINLQYILKRVENMYSNKYRYTCIHKRTIYNSQKVETVQMSID